MKKMKKNFIRLFSLLSLLLPVAGISQNKVQIYEQDIEILTYLTGEPNPDPIFYTPVQYQCAQMHVYPYVFLDNLTDNKVDKIYKGLFLENEYIKICVLPEIGGRLYFAEDKSNNYNYLYRNNVIKPALIGMAGAWMSGGIEWNIPHHHRASTFMQVDYELVENPDGSKSIFIGEYEKRHQTRWVVSLTLHQGKSYIETTIRYMNVTPVTTSFLFFANSAVHANENYQVFFAPDVELAANHTKNEYSYWPIAKNEYRGFDYGDGLDMSLWKNTAVPVSFFAYGSNMDFFGGIDHGKKAGIVFVADHHIFPGQKMWNWGKNNTASLWDEMLTDNDGTYLELMMGMYSDNQPDYSWNNPLGTRWGTMFFYPLRNMKNIKNANKDFALNLELETNIAFVQINATSTFKNVKVILTNKEKEIISETIQIDPASPWQKQVQVAAGTRETDLKLSIVNGNSELISYQPQAKKNLTIPESYKDPVEPSKIASVEELYLTGLRLEQFGNPYYNPLLYYEEGLRRDSGNAQINTSLGTYYLKNGMYKKAEKHLRIANKRVTMNLTRAKNGEPLYYLGLVLFLQQRYDEAYNLFYDATWCEEWVSPAYYYLAVIDCQRGNYNVAFDRINRSVIANNLNIEAQLLKASILRKINRFDEALSVIQSVSDFDPLNFTAIYEHYLILRAQNNTEGSENLLSKLLIKLRNEPDNYLETSWRYTQAGFIDDAIRLLNMAKESIDLRLKSYPLIYYYLGYNFQINKNNDASEAAYREAEKQPLKYCFPYGLASMRVLESAVNKNSGDASAHYLLGMLLCDLQPQNALSHWQTAVKINSSIAMAYRNIAFVQANIMDKIDDAIANMEKAISIDSNDPQFFFELDKYYAYKKVSPEVRFQVLQKNYNIVYKSTSALMQYIIVANLLGKYDEVLEIFNSYHFRVPEITEINPHVQWTDACLYLGAELLAKKQYDQAKLNFEKMLKFPSNLEVATDTKSELGHFWLGKYYKLTGNSAKARNEFELYVNYKPHEWSADWEPVMQFHKVMAYVELGRQDKAKEIINKMITKGEEGLKWISPENRDNRSISRRMDPDLRKSGNYLMIGLAYLGLGNQGKFHEMLTLALQFDPANIDAKNFMYSKEFVSLIK